MRKYNKETVMGNEFYWYEENGIRYSFMADTANSDYQVYLATLASELSNPSTPQAGE